LEWAKIKREAEADGQTVDEFRPWVWDLLRTALNGTKSLPTPEDD
jgi:hypothetical protein